MKEDNIVKENVSSLKQGIDFQRDIYKRARHYRDLEAMCSAIENIKGEIKLKASSSSSNKKHIKYVEKVIYWYRIHLKDKYTKKTPNGYALLLPSNVDDVIMRNFHVAYEKLIFVLESMDLV